ncbi:MAG: hypothetical protein R6T96_03285 [Longimicrobiales bacterium]
MPRFLLLLLILSAVPPGTAAQEALTLGLMPRAGLVSHDTYLYERFANFADDEPTEWTNGALGRAAYVALGVEAGWQERGLLLRGEVGRTLEGWLFVTHGIVRSRVFWDPPEIINTHLDVPAALTFANLQLVLPSRFNPWRLRPYFLFGGGGKWYHFGEPTRENTVEAILPSDGFTASLEMGAGLELQAGGLGFDIQIRDSLTEYWGKYQNDLVLSGGLIWRVR